METEDKSSLDNNSLNIKMTEVGKFSRSEKILGNVLGCGFLVSFLVSIFLPLILLQKNPNLVFSLMMVFWVVSFIVYIYILITWGHRRLRKFGVSKEEYKEYRKIGRKRARMKRKEDIKRGVEIPAIWEEGGMEDFLGAIGELISGVGSCLFVLLIIGILVLLFLYLFFHVF